MHSIAVVGIRRTRQKPARAGDQGVNGSWGRRSAAMCLAIPGQITEVVDDANRLAQVDVAGVKRTVNIGLLDSEGDGAAPGDWVLIHVGFALSKVDEEEAMATRKLLEAMGAEYEQELEELKASAIE